jgi:outer membrane usher protein
MNGGINWQLQIVPRVNLYTTFTDSLYARTQTLEGFMNLNVAFDGGHSVAIAEDVTAAAQETLIDASKPLPAGTGYGYRVDTAVGTTNSLQVDGQYQNQYARTEVDYSALNGGQHLAVTVGSALVFVPGAGVFVARTVQDAYAVVRVPGVSGVRVYANNQEMGRTDGNGNLLVPSLLPYYGNKLRIADTDVPPEYDVTSTERTIAPPYQGAALVTFGATRAHFYRGRLFIAKEGNLLTPTAYGDLVVHVAAKGSEAARDVTSPIGKNGEFEVAGVPPGRYAVEASYDEDTCTASLEVPESNLAVVEVGALRCVQH